LERGLIILGCLKQLAQEHLTYEWVQSEGITDVDQLRDFLRKLDPDAEKIGRKGIEALKQTRFLNWYDWRMQHWETKWNAMDTTVENIGANTAVIRFLTAWDPPMPVIRVLNEKFPGLSLCTV
jgi:hypothetical protein